MPKKQKQTRKAGTSKSRTEDWFETVLKSSEGEGLPLYKREYAFHPIRGWRFDFVWFNQEIMLAVEIQGGTWSAGAHVRGARYQEDCDKHNEAVRLGWKVFNFTTADIMGRPIWCLGLIREALELA